MTTVTANNASAGLQEGVVHLSTAEDGIATLRLGAASERVITLTERRLDSLKEVLLRLQTDADTQGLVVTGPGPEMFAAGADISLIESITDAADGERAATKGQTIFGMFQELDIPVVGAIEGPCLGGGLEMALCFDVRVASDDASTLIGLPEVKLGIIPGFGGTQRLSRLIGLPRALDLILQGKTQKPIRALRAGVIDRIVPAARLLDGARQEARKLIERRAKRPRRKLRGLDGWLSRVGFLRGIIRKKVLKKLTTGQARFYAAPPIALDLCIDAFRLRAAEGFAKEARALGELIVSPTCKALVHIYFLTERSKRLGKSEDAATIQAAHVIGGGAMGAGISGAMASRGLRVRLCDLSHAALAAAKSRLGKALHKRVKRKSLKPHEAMGVQDRLAVSTDWGKLGGVDFFLEAVVENLDVKRELFATAVAAGLPDEAILASNTSSLPIDEMAEGLPHPERVIGMHFFNPPEKMPLVEIIVGPRTSPAAIATTCRLAVRLGKFPVVVKDSPGFLVNRCLAPYLNEAAQLMLEGCEPQTIDKVMLDFGLPMGPARLMDEVGFDVAEKVSEVMSTAFPERMQPSPLFSAMVAAGHLGAKSGGGILSEAGTAVLTKLRQATTTRGGRGVPSRTEIHERLIYPMVDEAFRCLDDGLVDSEDDLDLGLIMGMGFPPFTGGIARFARAEGMNRIAARLEELAAAHGPRFAPSPGIQVRG
jgi:3-hydroxyacyl-CoA dehydrogenase / enoyl-CoA hydratase / 3-hydroxybutyryl-CoA epimerase